MTDDTTDATRRGLLKLGIVVAGGAAMTGPGALTAAARPEGGQSNTASQQARSAAVVTGRRFKGWVSRGSGPSRTTLEELTLRPITGRQVLVRTEATNLCYSNTGVVLGLPPNLGPGPAGPPPAPAPQAGAAPRPAAPPAGGGGFGRLNAMALIQGHGGVGVVEAVGPEVRRVQVGDRVCVSGTPQCGACYQCLRGRSDMCQFLGRQGPDDLVAMADMRDGTPVYANSHIGGLAEVMVTFEEWVVPGLHEGLGRRSRHGVQLRGGGRSRRDHVAGHRHPASRLHGGRGRLRSARAERRAGRTHLGRVHNHRHRSDSRAA